MELPLISGPSAGQIVSTLPGPQNMPGPGPHVTGPGDKNDPSRLIEVVTVNGRNSWRNRLFRVYASGDDSAREPTRTTDHLLQEGPAPGRVARLWNEQIGGYLYPGTQSWPPFYDVAHIPHIQIVRASQRAVPRTWAANDAQIPAVYVGNPV